MAEKTLKDTIILTLACGKYRFNKIDLGKIGDFPLSLILSWYEQKVVCILITLLSLGIKDIRIVLVGAIALNN